mmetsp:Transcript_19615/g.32704  ORF Transcript_19615/g.32704 Transcript_19615/m.32704 type:complete len:137 (-) Transcript_19615:303-713(-)
MGLRLNPRHSVNLLTGVAGTTYIASQWCVWNMRIVCLLVLLTTIIFHGAHVLGHQSWADSVFMKYDVGAVFIGTITLLFNTPNDFRGRVLFLMSTALGIWLLSWGPLMNLPLNPLASVIHVIGFAAHQHSIAHVCS